MVFLALEGDSAERLFEFMYTGCLTLNNSNAWTLLEGASSLDMPQVNNTVIDNYVCSQYSS